MNNILFTSLTQLLSQAPVLLVYLAGLTLALVYWRRCPTPCLLVLIATVLLLLASVTQPFVTMYLVRARAELDWTHEKLAGMLSAVALTGSLVRAAALGLVFAAVFLPRKVAPPPGYPH